MNNKYSSSIILNIITNWYNILKFLCFISGIITILFIGILSFLLLFRWLFPAAKIKVTNQGAYILQIGEKKTVQWLMSASSLWAPSGIEVKEGEEINIYVSGRANLGIHHLVESARTDEFPYFNWIGPEGINVCKYKRYLRNADEERIKNRINPESQAPFGILLMQIVPDGQQIPVRPHISDIYIIGDGKGKKFKMKKSGFLYFTLNEVPLDSTMKDVYLVTEEENKDKKYTRSMEEQKKAWGKIEEEEYWNIWYDDNVGSFLITIKFNDIK